MPVVLDTSAVVALFNRSDPAHAATVMALQAERAAIHVPLTVLTEAAWVVQRPPGRMLVPGLLRSIAASDWRLESLGPQDLERCGELIDRYESANLGFVDVSVMAVAERLGARRVYTLDRRDFSIVRPRHAEAFEILP